MRSTDLVRLIHMQVRDAWYIAVYVVIAMMLSGGAWWW